MFLIERLAGVGAYCCVLAAVYLLLVASPMKCKTALGFYILALCGMAAVYVPYRTADLYRIFEMMVKASEVKVYGAYNGALVITQKRL